MVINASTCSFSFTSLCRSPFQPHFAPQFYLMQSKSCRVLISDSVTCGIWHLQGTDDTFQTLITPLYGTEKNLVNQKNQNSKPSFWLGPEQHSFSPSSSPLLLPEDTPTTTTDVKVIYEPSMLKQQINIST